MDKVTQQNAANAEESATAAEEMSAQAEQMKGMVDELVAIVGRSGKAQKADSRSGRQAPKITRPRKAISTAVNKLKSKAGSAKKPAKPIAEAVIPLDDDQQVLGFLIKLAVGKTIMGPEKFRPHDAGTEALLLAACPG